MSKNIILVENTVFRKLDVFPSSDEGETPTIFGPVIEVSSF
jgi:hypothetical protein